VLVVVATRSRECLLLERIDPPGFWQSVTGTLHFGESVADAAARELEEETGIVSSRIVLTGETRRFPILPAWRARYGPGVTTNLEHHAYLVLEQRVPVRLNPAEHAAHCWLSLEEAVARVESWTNREALETLGTTVLS
jgi:dATP pyrophosphohydrolase